MKTKNPKTNNPTYCFLQLKNKKLAEKEKLRCEKVVAKDGDTSFEYATYVLKKRFPLGEKSIFFSGRYVEYHEKFFKERNPVFEEEIINLLKSLRPTRTYPTWESKSLYHDVGESIFDYSKKVIKGRWKEFEDVLINHLIKKFENLHHFILEYIREFKIEKWQEMEDYFIKTINFNNDEIGSCLELEDYIYETKSVMPKLEKFLDKVKVHKNPSYESICKFSNYFDVALTYAKCVKQDRWNVIDNWLKKDEVIDNYGIDKIYDYYELVESKIKKLLIEKDPKVLEYQDYSGFIKTVIKHSKNNNLIEEVKNYLLAHSLVDGDKTKSYFEADKKFKTRVKDFLLNLDQNQTVRETIATL